jgi:hypothetical protein
MQHNWFITGFILLFWAILLLITVLLNLRTAMLLMPIVLIILLLYLSVCLFFALYNRQPSQKIVKTVGPLSPKQLSHIRKEHKDGE